jgi:heme exporter protein B
MHANSPTWYFFYKMLAATLVFIIPICLITPVLALAYALSFQQIIIIISSMLISAPALCFLSGIFAALTVNVPQRTSLLNIMLLPLCIPIYILGVGCSQLSASGLSPYPAMALLAAISIAAVLLAPLLITISIRNSFEY